jgi:hypothetical protein
MKLHPITPHAETFRLAVESGDCSRAEAVLREYVAWFRSGPRTLQEIEAARNLFEWGVQAATSRKAHLAEELMFLTRVFDGYVPPRRSHTWRLDG